jgi:prophage maintenance system killer protein
MKNVTYLTLADFEIICWELNLFFTKQKDPPPIYEQSYFDKLDSIIAIPRKTYDKKDLYKSIYEKAACYFYFINKIHPFSNGNKRISIVQPMTKKLTK